MIDTLPETPTPDAPVLDTETIVGFLGLTNTELKCLALTALDTGVPTHERVAHYRVMVDAEGDKLHHLPPSNFRKVYERMPETVVTSEPWHRGGNLFTKTEVGELATAVAGHNLTLSVDTSIPTRILLGQHKPSSRLPGEVVSMDSIEARLVVLAGLYKLAQGRWQNSSVLYEEFEQLGLHHRAALSHIIDLRKIHFVEHRMRARTRGGVQHEYRLRSGDGYREPAEVIGQLLRNLARFAALSPTFIQEGIVKARTIAEDPKVVPYLVKRSFVSAQGLNGGRINGTRH